MRTLFTTLILLLGSLFFLGLVSFSQVDEVARSHADSVERLAVSNQGELEINRAWQLQTTESLARIEEKAEWLEKVTYLLGGGILTLLGNIGWEWLNQRFKDRKG